MNGAPKGELRIFLERRLQIDSPLSVEEKRKIARDFEVNINRVTVLIGLIQQENKGEEENQVQSLAFGKALEDLLKKIGFDDLQADYVVGFAVLGTPWREWEESGWSRSQAIRVRKIIAKTAKAYLPQFDRLLGRYHYMVYVKKMSEV